MSKAVESEEKSLKCSKARNASKGTLLIASTSYLWLQIFCQII